MTTLNPIHSNAHGFGRIGALRAEIRGRYDAWKVYRATYRELDELGDRELNDLGLGRADIESVARRAAYGA